jgi:hypothetical protein
MKKRMEEEELEKQVVSEEKFPFEYCAFLRSSV